MSNRYIEISSTYRDRNEYPLQSKFSISTNLSIIPDLFTSKDPISYQYPVYMGVVGSAVTSSANFNGGTYKNPELDPTSSSTLVDFYRGYTLNDTTLGQQRIIEAYDPTNSSVILNLPFSSGWNVADDYTIVDTNTLSSTRLSLQPLDVFGKSVFPVPENFVGMYLYTYHWDGSKYILGTYSTTILASYDPATYSYKLTNSIGGPLVNGDITIIRKQPILGNGLLVGSASNSVTLSGSSSSQDNYYRGKYLFIIPFNVTGSVDPGISNNQNYIYKIVSYDGATKVATLDKVVNTSNFVGGTVDDRLYEILDFSMDNAQNYYFSGSRLSQESAVCTDLEVLAIILPNVPLKTGSRTSLYPYFYVNIESSNGSFNNYNSIYSNNPNARKNTFLIPVYDTTNPLSTAFIKLDSAGMIPKLKFNPKEPLSFSITLPDGSPFETLQPDTMSPLPPNPLLQITVLLGANRNN